MSIMAFEGFFQEGVIHLSPSIKLPEMTKVFVIIPTMPVNIEPPPKYRTPSEKIAGKGQILGDIISETFESDWEVFQ